jgi:hypothetical protein
MIRMSLAIVAVILGLSSRAQAINWEGHEDWLEGTPHALELKRELRNKHPPEPTTDEPGCQKREEVGRVPANPYEPVPLLCGERRRR